jgi:hypothetical protein
MAVTAMLIWSNGSLVSATVSSYRFVPSAGPSFLFSGGDLLWVNIAAQLSGEVSIDIDENTGTADLRFDDVVIHSAYGSTDTHELTPELPDHWEAEFYEGKLLAELDAFEASIAGQRISTSEIKFGPSVSDGTIRYQQHFSFTVDGDSYRLWGGSFHSDDSPNYYIYGRLVSVPEPSITGISIVAAGILSCHCRVRRRRECAESGAV